MKKSELLKRLYGYDDDTEIMILSTVKPTVIDFTKDFDIQEMLDMDGKVSHLELGSV